MAEPFFAIFQIALNYPCNPAAKEYHPRLFRFISIGYEYRSMLMKRWICRAVFATVMGGILAAGIQAQVEFIPPTTVPPGGPPGVTFDYMNVLVPPPHEKVFSFMGGAESLGFPMPTPLVVFFDWTEPGGTFTSPPITFTITPFTTTPIDTGPFILPFCPRDVSIHFESPGPTPVIVTGAFSHICRQIPEPSGMLLVLPLLMSFVGSRCRMTGGKRT